MRNVLASPAPGDDIPDSKVHGVNMRPILGRQDPGGPHVGPKNFAIWVSTVGCLGICKDRYTQGPVYVRDRHLKG